jgi:hypothetical protein
VLSTARLCLMPVAASYENGLKLLMLISCNN